MFIDSNDALRRVEASKQILDASSSNGTRLEVIPRRTRGKEVPHFLRVAAGVAARIDSGRSTAKVLDMDDKTVSGYANGRLGSGATLREDTVLKGAVESILQPARDVALEKLMQSLNVITSDKLEKAGVNVASNVARNMAVIVEKTGPQRQNQPLVSLTVIAPQLRDERQYKIVEL